MEKEELFSRISHTQKNIAMVISMAAARALKSVEKGENPKELLEIIFDEAKMMEEISRDFSILNQALRPKMGNCDLHSFIQKHAKKFVMIGSSEVEFQFKLSAKILEVPCDVNLLRVAFDDIVKNAIEASAKKIVISTWIEEGMFQIGIANDGDVIPEEKIHEIFEPFETSKPEGTGLGLANAKTIVEEIHNGKIMVKSEKIYTGKGDKNNTEFIISLPVFVNEGSS